MRFEFDCWLTTDGGALFNTTAKSAGYGSYHLKARTGEEHTMRLDFGCGMTKQRACDPAEYRTLIAGSKDLVGHIQCAGKLSSAYSLLVHNDSQLMVGQLTQAWQVKAANLRPLVDEAAAFIQAFGWCDPQLALGTGLAKVPHGELAGVHGH